jgi:hypothetical protein
MSSHGTAAKSMNSTKKPKWDGGLPRFSSSRVGRKGRCVTHSITSSARASTDGGTVGGRHQGSSQATDQECSARRPEPARMRPCRQRHRLHARASWLA